MRAAPSTGLTFQLVPSDELVSFITAWLDSKILLLRLRWQFTWEQEACWVMQFLNRSTGLTSFGSVHRASRGLV